MSDPNETLPLVQAYKEIDRLKAELAKAQAENVRMAAALHFVADECNWELFGDGGDDRIGPACWDTLDGASNALRELLAPTIELLEHIGSHFNPKYIDLPHTAEACRKEVAYLRAATEGKV